MERVEKNKQNKKWNKFINGHNMKTPEARKIQSEAKVGKNHPYYGQKRPGHAIIMTGRKRPAKAVIIEQGAM